MQSLGEIVSKVFRPREETIIAKNFVNEEILKSIQETINTYAKVIKERIKNEF